MVKPVLAQQLIQTSTIEGMTQCCRQVRRRDPHRRLPVELALTQRHGEHSSTRHMRAAAAEAQDEEAILVVVRVRVCLDWRGKCNRLRCIPDSQHAARRGEELRGWSRRRTHHSSTGRAHCATILAPDSLPAFLGGLGRFVPGNLSVPVGDWRGIRRKRLDRAKPCRSPTTTTDCRPSSRNDIRSDVHRLRCRLAPALVLQPCITRQDLGSNP